MTWLKVDDKLTTHPKWLALTLEAKSLWFHAAVWCAAHNNDGHIPDDAMPLIAFSASLTPDQAAPSCDRLVKAKLWRRRSKRDGGGFDVNDWLEYQPSRQQVKDRQAADELADEIQRLHDWLHKKAPGKRCKQLILARDGERCRYCGERVRSTPGDRRSPHRRTFDLIDPASRWDIDASALHDTELARIADLWVVACGWCNAIKGKRTPDEADMRLHEATPVSRRDVLPRSASNGSGAGLAVGPGLPRDGHGTGPVGSGAAPAAPPPGPVRHLSSVEEPPAPPPPDDHHYTGDRSA